MEQIIIQTTTDVHYFFQMLQEQYGIIVHPDNDFRDYLTHDTQKPIFKMEEADYLNELMTICFQVCRKSAVEIYELSIVHQYKTNFMSFASNG
jgi:hypothetical protein